MEGAGKPVGENGVGKPVGKICVAQKRYNELWHDCPTGHSLSVWHSSIQEKGGEETGCLDVGPLTLKVNV